MSAKIIPLFGSKHCLITKKHLTIRVCSDIENTVAPEDNSNFEKNYIIAAAINLIAILLAWHQGINLIVFMNGSLLLLCIYKYLKLKIKL